VSITEDIVTLIDGLRRVPDLVHGYTTRSLGDLSFRTSGEAAGERRRTLASALDIDPMRMFSIPLGHTNRVVVLENPDFLSGINRHGYLSAEKVRVTDHPTVTDNLPDPEHSDRYADGVVWQFPDVFSLIITADCAAVAFYDPVTGACGNSHVGLLGAVNRLPEAMLTALQTNFDSDPADIEVVIYPCIRKCHYDITRSRTWQLIKQDVFAAYGADNAFFADNHFDLPGFVTHQLMEAGVRKSHVHDTWLCTVCHYDKFFSHVGATTPDAQAREGRFGAVIGVR
jgi:copper oxidase (laccase) domain-containing protein